MRPTVLPHTCLRREVSTWLVAPSPTPTPLSIFLQVQVRRTVVEGAEADAPVSCARSSSRPSAGSALANAVSAAAESESRCFDLAQSGALGSLLLLHSHEGSHSQMR